MDTSKVLGTHMISMTVDLAILHIDEIANKIRTGFQHYDKRELSDVRTTNIRYDSNGEAFVERFRVKYYLSDFMRSDLF